MDTKNTVPPNRVETALNRWQVQEQKYVQRFGNNVFRDLDFMKVKAGAYKLVFDQFINSKLNFEEKMDLRILRGQMRQMNQRIYPNPYLRTARSAVPFLLRPLQAVGKLGVNILSYLVTGKPYFSGNNNRPQAARPTPARNLTVAKDNTPVLQTAQKEQHQEIKRNLRRARVLTTEIPGKTMRR